MTKKNTRKTSAKPTVRAKSKSSTRASSSRTKRNAVQKPIQKISSPATAVISTERRIDILGIILIVIGVLTLMSLFASNSGKLTDIWKNFLLKIMGWGAFILPISFVLFGMWLLLRNLQKFPQISGERILGFILGYINLLTWFHLIKDMAGGTTGQFIINILGKALGSPGAIVAISAWLLTSLILLLDLSMADVTKKIGDKSTQFGSKIGHYFKTHHELAQKRKANQKRLKEELDENHSATLPSTSQEKPQDISEYRQKKVVAEDPEHTFQNHENGKIKTRLWVLPDPSQILLPIKQAPIGNEVDQHRARVIEETLKSFSTPAHVVEIRRGPAITLFGVKPDFIESRSGRTLVRVSNIVRLQDDIAMALQATQIRIQAPVPGKDYVGIEVPNGDISPVSLLEVIQSDAFTNNKGPLRFGLGKDVSGNPIATDLTNMPHLLIAGATNSGKSVCINAILAGYLMTLTPDQLRIILVDPKRVELTNYNGIPHLLAPVIVEADRVVGALQWLMREMDVRFHKFSDMSVRNITEYNLKQQALNSPTLPYLLLVIDEMADLMMLAPDETEKAITRLAQLARATGIHLILATQRPSTDIITGLIKANFPARIAFAVASGVDSRVILDQPGAERLLGRGDMLFLAPDAPAPVRLQGTYVSDQEINDLVNFWHKQSIQENAPQKPENPVSIFNNTSIPYKQDSLWEEMQKEPNEDPLTKEAISIIRQEGRASVSMLQRKMRIGYTRSARLIETLERKGIIGAPDPQTQVREVLDFGKNSPPAED